MFWEILKASKGLPVTDQYAALWGKKIAEAGGWKVTEITGELPLIFLSDGSVLVDYKIYGTSAGAGVETENLYNYLDDTANCFLKSDGTLKTDETGYYTSDFIAVEPNATYTITRTGSVRVKGYDSTKQPIRTDTYNDYGFLASAGVTFTVDSNTHYIRFTLTSAFYNSCTLVEGSTPPDRYIPHGYKLPLTVESGETENLWKGNYEHAVLSGASPTEFKFVTSINGRTAIVPCEPNATYIIKKYSESNRLIIADSINRPNNEDICEVLTNQPSDLMEATVTTHIDAHWMSIYVSTSSEQAEPNITVTKGSTPPDHYIPHRYTLDVPIYIGSSKLGKEEYVDFGEQKVYKMSEGVLMPTDPPVPFPAITAYKGENTLSSTETLGETIIKGRIRKMTYRRVEYLKSTGTQYIQTDIVPSYSYKSELRIKFGSEIHQIENNDYTYIFGISGAAALGVYCAQLDGNSGNIMRFRDGYYSTDTSITGINPVVEDTLIMNRPTSFYGNASLTTNAAIESLDPPVEPIIIFGLIGVSAGNKRIWPFKKRDMFLYEFKIYDSNDSLLHDLIPVERKGGELGLLDTITNKFYANAGTGTFEKGDYI